MPAFWVGWQRDNPRPQIERHDLALPVTQRIFTASIVTPSSHQQDYQLRTTINQYSHDRTIHAIMPTPTECLSTLLPHAIPCPPLYVGCRTPRRHAGPAWSWGLSSSSGAHVQAPGAWTHVSLGGQGSGNTLRDPGHWVQNLYMDPSIFFG